MFNHRLSCGPEGTTRQYCCHDIVHERSERPVIINSNLKEKTESRLLLDITNMEGLKTFGFSDEDLSALLSQLPTINRNITLTTDPTLPATSFFRERPEQRSGEISRVEPKKLSKDGPSTSSTIHEDEKQSVLAQINDEQTQIRRHSHFQSVHTYYE